MQDYPLALSRNDSRLATLMLVWRVLDLAAPSLKLSPYVDWHYRELPFSVKVDKKLHVRDVMAMKRDLYEGTAFDLTQGPPSGPYGNPGELRPWTHPPPSP